MSIPFSNVYTNPMNTTLLKLTSLPKTIYFNLKVLPFKEALKLPFLVSRYTKLMDLSGKFVLDAPLRRFSVRIGIGGAGTCLKDGTSVEIPGTVIFKGPATIGGKCQICVNKNGVLEVGSNVMITSECHLVASKKISIGDGTMISWGTQIMDTDMHELLTDGKVSNPDGEVAIGQSCWITSNVTVHKGTVIPKGSVIASGSVIKGVLTEENALYTGLPVKVLKSNVSWR